MKMFSALILIGVATVLVRMAGGYFDPGSDVGQEVIYTIGLLLLGAWLVGRMFEEFHLPHITGYIAVGILLGPSVLGWIDKTQHEQMGFANSLAISLIALTAGGEIRFHWLKSMAKRLLILIGVDVTIVLVLCVSGLLLASMVVIPLGDETFRLIPFMADLPWKFKLVIAMLAGTVMIANSPAVVIAMVADYRCAGPLTRTALAMTVMKDMVLIVVFATVLAVSRAVVDPGGELSAEFVAGVSVQLLGSFVIGAIFGVGMAWYVYKIKHHMLPFVIGCCMLFALIGEQYFIVLDPDQPVHLEALLIALAAGVLMQNLWPKESEPLFHTVEESSLPVYCLFFGLAGAKIDIFQYSELWLVLLVLVMFLIRGFAIFLGVRVGCRIAGIEGDAIKRLWMGMIPQAGIAIVLVELIKRTFSDNPETAIWADAVFLMLMGMIVIHESLGPIAFKYALSQSGEIGQAEGIRKDVEPE